MLGMLGLTTYRDAFLAYICRLCVPGCQITPVDISNISKEMPPTNLAHLFAKRLMIPPPLLTDRNLQFVRTLVAIVTSIKDTLDSKTWFVVFETLQIVDGLMSIGRIGKRMESSPTLIENNSSPLSASLFRARASTMAISATRNIDRSQFEPYAAYSREIFDQTEQMRTKTLGEFILALCRLAQENVVGSNGQTPKEKVNDEKCFAITKLNQVALLNIKRLIDPEDFSIFDVIVGQLIQMAHSPGLGQAVRTQVMGSFGEILLSAVQNGQSNSERTEKKLLFTVKTIMALDNPPIGQEDLYSKLAWLPEIQRAGFEILYKLLQTNGQHFSVAWGQTLEIINGIVKCAPIHARPDDAVDGAASADLIIPQQKLTMVKRAAFPCLQIICADFLALLSPGALAQCIDTVTEFAAAADELNICLTSVGLLWSICDFILTKRQQLEKVEESNIIGSLSSLVMGRPSINDIDFSCSISTHTMDYLWMRLLQNLSKLCSDERAELRNSANQTLFRTIGMNGLRLTMEAWELCISDVLFPLFDKIRQGSQLADKNIPTPSRGAAVAFGVKSPSQQWDETKIITITGLVKSLTEFLPVLVTLEHFSASWNVFLQFIKATCLEGTSEVSVAAFKQFRLLAQYRTREQEQSDISRTKLPSMWFSMWGTWADIGIEICNGISSDSILAESEQGAVPLIAVKLYWSDASTPRLIHGYMSQEALAIYLSIFADIFEVIKELFDTESLSRLLFIVRNVLVYHSMPPADASQTKIRSDMINDLENLSAVQMQAIDLISGKPNMSHVSGYPALIIKLLADITVLPYIVISGPSTPAVQTPLESPSLAPAFKRFTYMALSKRIIELIDTVLAEHADVPALFSESSPIPSIFQAFKIPLALKYQCPKAGQKDPTPIWKLAVSSSLAAVEIVLKSIESQNIRTDGAQIIYDCILKMFSAFLQSARYIALMLVRHLYH